MAAIIDFNQYPKVSVGSFVQKNLHDVPVNEFLRMRGEAIAQGDNAIVYEKKGDPTRLYKVISENFNGDEVRAAKVAGEIKVAPAFHGAFKAGPNVVIEMDKGYEKLGKTLQALSKIIENNPEGRVSIKGFVEIMYGAFNEHYPDNKNPDDFYLDVFSKVKALAERRFSYTDPNAGNILFDFDTRDTQLIDFGSSYKTESVEEAVKGDFRSACFKVLWGKFKELPNLSRESQDLIEWFESRR